jgi:hypothetical protein
MSFAERPPDAGSPRLVEEHVCNDSQDLYGIADLVAVGKDSDIDEWLTLREQRA